MRANGIASRHSSNKDLIKEISALKAHLQKLSTAIEARAIGEATRTLESVESGSKDAINSAIEAAQEFIDDYSEMARNAAENLSEKAGEAREAAAETLVEAVRARPLGTLAAVVGAGFVAGYLCRRP
jgi:ElaB/YqjD/DUF883 family membrane-anchored ribosome-binding protein